MTEYYICMLHGAVTLSSTEPIGTDDTGVRTCLFCGEGATAVPLSDELNVAFDKCDKELQKVGKWVSIAVVTEIMNQRPR